MSAPPIPIAESMGLMSPADRDLLEMAAIGGGVKIASRSYSRLWILRDGRIEEWNPLTYSGDAFRLLIGTREHLADAMDDLLSGQSEADIRRKIVVAVAKVAEVAGGTQP